MKKLGNFYKTHRVLVILMAIAIVCLIVIGVFLIGSFYVNKDGDKYGSRLQNIEDYPLEKDRLIILQNKYEENENVDKVEMTVTGRIVYTHILSTDAGTLDALKEISSQILEEFSEDEKKYYDFHFTIKKISYTAADGNKIDGFLVLGAHNKNGNGLNWNNMRPVENTQTETQ